MSYDEPLAVGGGYEISVWADSAGSVEAVNIGKGLMSLVLTPEQFTDLGQLVASASELGQASSRHFTLGRYGEGNVLRTKEGVEAAIVFTMRENFEEFIAAVATVRVAIDA